LLEDIEEQLVRIAISLLEDAVEIAHRLMIVQNKAKANRIHSRKLAAADGGEISGIIGISRTASTSFTNLV
jgi:hypothetical protein